MRALLLRGEIMGVKIDQDSEVGEYDPGAGLGVIP
jgi:hypothetical protein